MRRLILIIPLIVGVTLVAFLVSHLTPVNPVLANLGQRAVDDPKIVAAYETHWGLNKPLWVQYGVYLANLAHGNFGQSISTGRPVSSDLVLYFPATLELASAAVILTIILGIGLGLLATAARGKKAFDAAINVLALIGASVPAFWFGIVALGFVYYRLGWLPGSGELSPQMASPAHLTGMYIIDSFLTGNWTDFVDALSHLVLPAVSLAIYWIGVVTRVVRSSLGEVLLADYIRTARAKGLRERTILLRHAFRNALIPVLTIVGLAYGGLLSGAVLVEAIFSWPGVGQYAYRAALASDFPAIMGVTLVVSLAYIIINLVVDILYGVVNPTVTYD